MTVFPAWAGVILITSAASAPSDSVPRMGGGDPQSGQPADVIAMCSPHGRG